MQFKNFLLNSHTHTHIYTNKLCIYAGMYKRVCVTSYIFTYAHKWFSHLRLNQPQCNLSQHKTITNNQPVLCVFQSTNFSLSHSSNIHSNKTNKYNRAKFSVLSNPTSQPTKQTKQKQSKTFQQSNNKLQVIPKPNPERRKRITSKNWKKNSENKI